MAGEIVKGRAIRLRDYRYPGELLSLVLTFLTLITLYGLATIFFPETWSSTLKALMVTLAGLTVYIITVKLQQRAAFGTLVRVSPRQFPELYELAVIAAGRLSSPAVPVYVKRASEMNIYTLGLWQGPLIVLTSSLVDQMEPDNLQFFIGREIGHVQAGHTWLRTLLRPLGTDVPIIGRLLNSVVFGDWINRAEFTADRAGFIACRSLTTSVSTMLKFGVGIRLYEKLDIKEFLQQINEVRNMSGHLTEILAEQPYLTQRVRLLVRFALSDRYRTLVPGRKSHTEILEAIPEAFISSSIALSEITPLIELKTQTENEDQLKESQTSFGDEVITVAEFLDKDPLDENAPDPRLTLIAADGSSTHILRRLYTRIGRNQDNDIVINNDRVSRYHAEIIREGEEMKVLDKKSRNGVWLNGARISESAVIKSGDLIRIGRQEFTFVEKNITAAVG
ncbi:MAG: FHA domain-containing protein [Acidobacteria bacterium]|nr:FHA domain-containing protein [Acidobacteriota bacterium]